MKAVLRGQFHRNGSRKKCHSELGKPDPERKT